MNQTERAEAGREIERPNVGYEPDDLRVFYIAATAGLIIIFAVIIFAAVNNLRKYFAAHDASRERQPISRLNTVRQPPPEPRLQIEPENDLRKMREAADEAQRSYGWVDRQQGIVRIPIEQAMTLLAARGLPVVSEQATVNESAMKKTAGQPAQNFSSARSGRTVQRGKQ